MSCSGEPESASSDVTPTDSGAEVASEPLVIKEISEIDSYSYIGVGTDNESTTRAVTANLGKRILGIRKSDGKAEAVRFKDRKGRLMESSPCVTAELTTESFSFYKLSYETSDYYGTDFISAPGDMYCFCSDNGYIYRLEGITGMYAERCNYDCYDGTFIGSFIFEDKSERFCKVYIKDGEIQIDKKIDVKDFPEFKMVFMDRNKNVFAYITHGMQRGDVMSYCYPLKYILTNNDKICAIDEWVILGYNRVVYGNRGARYSAIGVFDASNVRPLKEILNRYVLVDNKLITLSLEDLNYYDIENLDDGTLRYTSNGSDVKSTVAGTTQTAYEYYGTTFTGKPYYNIDLAYTTGFIPPELCYESWSNCNEGAYRNWFYSELVDTIGNKYIYMTASYDYNRKYTYNHYGLTVVEFSDTNPLEYTVNFCSGGNQRYEITNDWAYGDGKIYFFKDNVLRVVDIEADTNTLFTNSDIVKYHSIERVNNNKVAFLGTNSDASKVYYEINTSDDSITLLGSSPTFSSVSFRPINRQ